MSYNRHLHVKSGLRYHQFAIRFGERFAVEAHIVKTIRLIKKLAPVLNGIDLSTRKVGQTVEMPDRSAHILMAEGWAELVEPEAANDPIQCPNCTRRGYVRVEQVLTGLGIATERFSCGLCQHRWSNTGLRDQFIDPTTSIPKDSNN